MCVVGDRRSRLRLENHKVSQKVFRLNEHVFNNLLPDGFCHLPIEEKNRNVLYWDSVGLIGTVSFEGLSAVVEMQDT